MWERKEDAINLSKYGVSFSLLHWLFVELGETWRWRETRDIKKLDTSFCLQHIKWISLSHQCSNILLLDMRYYLNCGVSCSPRKQSSIWPAAGGFVWKIPWIAQQLNCYLGLPLRPFMLFQWGEWMTSQHITLQKLKYAL